MEQVQSTSQPSSQPASQPSSNENPKKNNYRRRNHKKSREGGNEVSEEGKNQDQKPKHHRRGKPKTEKPKVETPESESTEKSGDDDGEEDDCFICTQPIKYYAVAPCDHRTCHICTLRLRVLYKTDHCAYCKAKAEQVIFTKDATKLYASFQPSDTPYSDKKLGIHFETEKMYKDTLNMVKWNCPECKESFGNWQTLKQHVKQEHHRLCCDLCLKNKKIFSHEHTLYTQSQLQKHYSKGDTSFNKDDETGFTGHPECVFCKSRFYSGDELFEHCRSKHEQCHICVKNGVQHQYYANYDSLEQHFKQDHFLCQYRECLSNKFVVFDSDIDLKAHELKEHANMLSRQQRAKQSRVDVNIQYATPPPPSHRNNAPIQLSAHDFPNMDGSLPSQLASTHITPPKREDWPTLGEDPVSRTGSPSQSSSTNESIVSRHAAALDRIADLYKNMDKMIKFRQLISKYTQSNQSTKNFVEGVYELCDKDAQFTVKILTAAKDIIDNTAQKSKMITYWNNKKSSVLIQEDAPKVLIAKPDQPRSQQNNKKPGVWDRVASAASDAGAYRQSFPTIQPKTTPWSTGGQSSSSSAQDSFPALPTANQSRRAEINSMIKKTNTNAWGSSSTQNESEYSDSNDTGNKKKKGKKGKQVLFRVGL